LLTIEYLQDTIKEIVRDTVVPQFTQKRSMWNEMGLGEGGKDINVRGVRYPSYMSPNESHGYPDEGGDLPEPGTDVDRAMRVGYIRYYRGFKFSQDFLLHQGKPEMLIKNLSERFNRYRVDAELEFAQQIYGDGKGTKAIVLSRDSATKFTCATEPTDGSTAGATQLSDRQRLQFFSAGGTQRTGTTTGIVVKGINQSIAQVEVTSAANIPTDVVAGDHVCFEKSFNKAIRGFGYHIAKSSTMYQTLDKGEFPQLNPVYHDAQARRMNWALLSKIKHSAKFKRDESGMTMVVAPVTQIEAIENLGHSLRRLDGQSTALHTGFEKIEGPEGVYIEDIWAPENEILYVDKSSFEKLELKSLGLFTGQNGEILFLQTTSSGGRQAAWVGWMEMYCQLGCTKPRANGKLGNLAVDGGLVRHYLNM
jgi:hypothetical protein